MESSSPDRLTEASDLSVLSSESAHITEGRGDRIPPGEPVLGFNSSALLQLLQSHRETTIQLITGCGVVGQLQQMAASCSVGGLRRESSS